MCLKGQELVAGEETQQCENNISFCSGHDSQRENVGMKLNIVTLTDRPCQHLLERRMDGWIYLSIYLSTVSLYLPFYLSQLDRLLSFNTIAGYKSSTTVCLTVSRVSRRASAYEVHTTYQHTSHRQKRALCGALLTGTGVPHSL